MTTRLIAITKPVINECNVPGELIAYCARVSNPANQANKETAPKLLAYLAREHHWSPFEMASMTIEIVTTRDIARQILRHRSFSFQEFSQRYGVVEAGPVIREARMQNAHNRQASDETTDQNVLDWWAGEQVQISQIAARSYATALKAGIAKEVARAVLPEGLTESTLYMAGTIRSFLHYVQERTKFGVQKEHRLIAEEVKKILLEHFPALADLLSTVPKVFITSVNEAKEMANLASQIEKQRKSGGFVV